MQWKKNIDETDTDAPAWYVLDVAKDRHYSLEPSEGGSYLKLWGVVGDNATQLANFCTTLGLDNIRACCNALISDLLAAEARDLREVAEHVLEAYFEGDTPHEG